MSQSQQMDLQLLEAALVGYKYRIREIETRVAELRGTLEGHRHRAPEFTAVQTTTRKKHTVSAAGRKRMADAQRKRWAAVRASNA